MVPRSYPTAAKVQPIWRLARRFADRISRGNLFLFDRQLTVRNQLSNLPVVQNGAQRAHAAACIQPIETGREFQNIVPVTQIGEDDYVLWVMEPSDVIITSLCHYNPPMHAQASGIELLLTVSWQADPCYVAHRFTLQLTIIVQAVSGFDKVLRANEARCGLAASVPAWACQPGLENAERNNKRVPASVEG